MAVTLRATWLEGRALPVAVAVLLLVGTELAAPSVSLPKPSGPYAVGRVSHHLVDASRQDALGSHPDHKREFMAMVWYPAESSGSGRPAEWLPNGWAALETKGLLATQLKRSSEPAAKDITGVLNSVAVRAREDAPIARSQQHFPVILFSPGNLMFPTEYSALLEELASWGYVVIGHTPTGYVNEAFPDGRVTLRYAAPDFALWTGDLEFALDQVAEWNATPGNMFFGRLDLDHIGVMGHSGGANAAAQVAHADKRVKACVLLDPGILRVDDAAGPPFLLAFADNRQFFGAHADDPDTQVILRERTDFFARARQVFQVTLQDTDHNSFTDMTTIPAFARIGDGTAIVETTRVFVREFFGEFLLGRHSDLIRSGSSKYPLAKVHAKGGVPAKSVRFPEV